MVELEDLALRRDYRLIPKFYDWCKCGRMLWLFRNKDTIFLKCANFHIWNIMRHCNKCDTEVDFETHLCPRCEPIIREITQYEVNIIQCQKGLKKLGRQLKEGTIVKELYGEIEDEYSREIEVCQANLKKAIEKRSVILTKQQSGGSITTVSMI